ncbi:hypothetical protein KGF54_000575 [Candida jiufengensis]|uniref:uncharacterized protein n=1 Tax=Candida jiufengensis TaxID=497108 RepID=UPI002224B05C|nr:uncharacterized protein KGF54_000575 [Candida jiufengensis]KAI5956956.1 hypothetical protein KGF54_000575 [Candida jiufengensis]
MKSLSDFKKGAKIKVNDRMQKDYEYEIVADGLGAEASDFNENGFNPDLTPEQVLSEGAFEGKYLNDCEEELPKEWFENSKKKRVDVGKPPDIELNRFKIKSRQSLVIWRENDWVMGDDPRGWFQWYCRYWLGRRNDEIDKFQKKRWRAFKRHHGQVKKNCKKGDLSCRPKQRQALLQWAYDPFV